MVWRLRRKDWESGKKAGFREVLRRSKTRPIMRYAVEPSIDRGKRHDGRRRGALS
jgi:hypothetical protein